MKDDIDNGKPPTLETNIELNRCLDLMESLQNGMYRVLDQETGDVLTVAVWDDKVYGLEPLTDPYVKSYMTKR